MSDDHSPGDRRQPYSDIGGPEARHAQTHDVQRELATNPRGPEPEDVSFDQQLAPAESGQIGGHATESAPAAEDKLLHEQLPTLTNDELARLSVLEPGARLEQGGAYLDLNRRAAGPFQAIGGHIAGKDERLIAKRDTDFELWNRLVGPHRAPEIERPEEGGRP